MNPQTSSWGIVLFGCFSQSSKALGFHFLPFGFVLLYEVTSKVRAMQWYNSVTLQL